MSHYQRALSSFLAKTFYPVTVSFNSTPIMYSNPLFSVTHRIKASKYTDNICGTGYIKFNWGLNKYQTNVYVDDNKLNTPESFLKYMLDNPKTYTTFELTKTKEKVEFNTNGTIPIRYLDIYNDFSPYKFEYKTPSKLDIELYEKELYETKLAYINNNILYDIYTYARYLSEKERGLKIVVTKGPQYPFNIDFFKKYYNYGTFCKEESPEFIKESLKQREWKSADGDFSTPVTKIFINRSRELKSLNNNGYQKLFSSSGGIDFSYARELPWFQLKHKMGDSQPYYDVSGHDTYYMTSNNIGITEFVIFGEALAKDGAEFTLEYV
jgi:hypothetical protein